MKFTIALAAIALYATAYSQKVQLKEFPDVKWPIKHYENNRANVNCDVDTVTFVAAKTTSVEAKILYSDGSYSSSASQMFGASAQNPVTVHGFRWYGYSYDPIGGGSPVVNITCELYNVGSDSLPTGSPLATTSISVDANIANAQRDVLFPTPVAVTSNYALVITNPSTDWLILSSNDEDVNDGMNQGLSASFYEPANAWTKSLNLWALGDFDFIMEPFASHVIDAKYNAPTQGCVGIPVASTNTSKGSFNSIYYNQDKFNGGPLSHHWTYGDGNSSSFQVNGNNTYVAPGTYSVILKDTLHMWTGYCVDSVSKTIDIYAIPAAPTSTPPAPVCEYTPALDLTASGSGTNFTWYGDAGLSNQIGTGSPFASGIILADTVYVTVTVNSCESAGTEVVLDFLPNAIPTFTPVFLGAFQVDFNGAPVADIWAWDFGDGLGSSALQNPNYTYIGAGPHNACLDVTYSNGCTNQYCENISFVGVNEEVFENVAIYPNPANTTITVDLPLGLEGTDCALYDLDGKLITRTPLNGLITNINIAHLSSGVYVLRLVKEKAVSSYRISKL